MRKPIRFVVCPVLFFLGAISGSFAQERSDVATQIEERTGYGLRPEANATKTREFSLPPGVSLDEALSEQDAVAVALWNNAELEATLVQLGLARADLIEAGLLVNPDIQFLLGIGAKPFEFLLSVPIEALWQRPRRVAAAKLNLENVSKGLVQNGIDLVRDVRIAYAQLALAGQRAKIRGAAARLRKEIADLTDKRLQHGDISALDARLARIEALTAEDAAAQAEREVGIAQHRLGVLLGIPGDSGFSIAPLEVAVEKPSDEKELLEAALSSRPDLKAAELAIESAGRRAGWERSRILAYIAPLLSTKEVGSSGIKSGPGLKIEIPVFNRNQGGISRAEAEVKQATLRYLALADQVQYEVRSSRIRLLQAQESLERIRNGLLSTIEETIDLAKKAHENGDISYLDYQLASAPIFDARLSEEAAAADLRQALAELERAIGRRL
jgi:cobalt-zinc-cadmium efflux system outer membrane protein